MQGIWSFYIHFSVPECQYFAESVVSSFAACKQILWRCQKCFWSNGGWQSILEEPVSRFMELNSNLRRTFIFISSNKLLSSFQSLKCISSHCIFACRLYVRICNMFTVALFAAQYEKLHIVTKSQHIRIYLMFKIHLLMFKWVQWILSVVWLPSVCQK